jgi:steroid delta-isomerase-like uncharacterized protein
MEVVNQTISARYYDEILTRRRLEVFEEIFSPDFLCYSTDGTTTNLGQYKAAVNMSHSAFADLHVTIQDQIAAADKVVTRWTATGTHTGNFLGIPPTGKPLTISAIHIHQFKDHRITGLWEAINLHLVLFQLEIFPR